MAPDGGALTADVDVSACALLDAVSVDTRLRTMSLRVPNGKRVALLGRNGIGKSTVLRAIAGLVPVQHGTVRAVTPVGYVPQDYAASLLPWFSVEANVLLGIPAGCRSKALERALFVVPPLRDWLRARPYRLSGGQQQLVVLARAVARAPRLLLLDEPFSALDLGARVQVRDALVAACSSMRSSAVLVTHDPEDAAAFAEHAIVLAGRPTRVAFEGPLRDGAAARLQSLILHDSNEAVR